MNLCWYSVFTMLVGVLLSIKNGQITIILGGNGFCTRFVLKKNSSGLWVTANKYSYKGIDNLRIINHEKYVVVYKKTVRFLDDKKKYFPEVEDIDSVTYSSLTTEE